MTESTDASTHPATMFDTWMKSVNDFWSNMATPFPPSDIKEEIEKEKTSDTDFWKTGMETWQSIASAMSQSTPTPSPLAGIGTFPQTFLEMTQPVFSSITQMLQQWQDQSLKSDDYIKPFDFNTIDTDILNIWKKLYDNEFRKFFKIPQLGLAREHQEKVARFLDRFNLLQSTMAEFLNFLAIPFKKTHTNFQEKLTELAQKNDLPRDVNDYYRIWLKILEGHYMTLFQSPDYIHSLGKTLTASAAYTRAKKELVNDLLQQLSIPSSEHMDAVYKELHGLKKRIKVLEKAIINR
ncbi:MAG: hypothetical protein HF978_04340 [Desulfobacteraceae bacterium]|nr:hypothetical protein [Desulfobacteraceae bacterium]MBC2754757.1 hypothetical protein [Desulfobacteraceae bacterium]